MLLVRSVHGATLHKLHGNISVWSHNFCNTPWIKVGNTTNVKSYLIDRIRPVDLVLLQNLFSACLPPGLYDESIKSDAFFGSSKMRVSKATLFMDPGR